MIPQELDLPIVRDATFRIELVSQVKSYTYDPTVHTEPADLQRTHTENLEHHGFVYEYIDFATDYDSAELVISKAYAGGSNEPIKTLGIALPDVTGIELTDKSVIVTITPTDTGNMDFDTAVYKLRLLINATNEVDILTFGNVIVSGAK